MSNTTDSNHKISPLVCLITGIDQFFSHFCRQNNAKAHPWQPKWGVDGWTS